MNFTSAITSLRNGRCAKTPSMSGYVRRDDWSLPSSGGVANAAFPAFSTATSYSEGDGVFYEDACYVFTSAHPAGAWSDSHVAPATGAYDIVFVENPRYEDADQDSLEYYGFRARTTASRTYWQIATRPVVAPDLIADASLIVDAQLWGLFLRSDWDVYETSQIESSLDSHTRW